MSFSGDKIRGEAIRRRNNNTEKTYAEKAKERIL